MPSQLAFEGGDGAGQEPDLGAQFLNHLGASVHLVLEHAGQVVVGHRLQVTEAAILQLVLEVLDVELQLVIFHVQS